MCVLTKLSDAGFAKTCEDLGYDMLWIPDSQMIWGDCYAYMALAAQQTSRIRLGTGVSVAGTRIAPVVAHSIASVATLAPGCVVPPPICAVQSSLAWTMAKVRVGQSNAEPDGGGLPYE